jgi:DNA-binding MarR family transcriptional regulator
MKKEDNTQASETAGEIRVLISRLRRRAREVRPGGFTGPQLLTLHRLDVDGESTVSALARAEGVRPQSMGANIVALEAMGLVRRDPDPTDGRQSVISLTKAGRKFIEASRATRDDWLSRAIRTRLTAVQQKDLARGIQVLKELLEDY